MDDLSSGQREDDGQETLALRYTGKRFGDHSLSVQFLAELWGLQNALWEIYRHALKEATERPRAPKGFRELLELRLSSISAGSARLALQTQRPGPTQGVLPGFQQAATRDAVVRLIDLMHAGDQRLAPALKKNLARYLAKFGENLAEGEAIEVSFGKRSITYSQERRKSLLVELSQEYTRQQERVFAVSALDKVNWTCTLMSPTGEAVKASIAESFRDTMAAAFHQFQDVHNNFKVAASGVFTYNEQDGLKKAEVESFELLGKRDLRWRVPYLIHHSEDEAAKKNLRLWESFWNEHLAALHSKEHPALYLFDGIVSVEWDAGRKPVVELDQEQNLSWYEVEGNDLGCCGRALGEEETAQLLRAFLIKSLGENDEAASV